MTTNETPRPWWWDTERCPNCKDMWIEDCGCFDDDDDDDCDCGRSDRACDVHSVERHGAGCLCVDCVS